MNLKGNTAQMYANIAAEIYEDDDIKSLMENAESVSIKVGNERPVGFKLDEFAKIAKSREKKEKESHRIVDIEGVDVARIQILKAWKEFMDECSWASDFNSFLNTIEIRGLTVSQLFKVVNDFAAQAEEKDWKRIEGECEFLPEIDRSAIVIVEETSALRLKRLILKRYFRENARKRQSMYEFFNTVEVRGMPAGIVLEVFQDLLIENNE